MTCVGVVLARMRQRSRRFQETDVVRDNEGVQLQGDFNMRGPTVAVRGRWPSTHRQFRNEGDGRTAQLDYIVGPRRTSEKA